MAKPVKPTVYPDGVQAAIIAFVTDESGTSYTFTSSDDFKKFTSSSAVSATIPPGAGMPVPWVKGATISLIQYGTGQVTFVAGAGVTLLSKSGSLATASQYSVLTAMNLDGTDTWVVFGDLA